MIITRSVKPEEKYFHVLMHLFPCLVAFHIIFSTLKLCQISHHRWSLLVFCTFQGLKKNISAREQIGGQIPFTDTYTS